MQRILWAVREIKIRGNHGPVLNLPGTVRLMLTVLVLGGYLSAGVMGWTLHYDNANVNWTQARDWCQAHYTDLVSIQNQKENDYVSKHLPVRTGAPYYWIGLTRTAENSWVWIGTNGTWAGNNSWASNEPNNNLKDESCVEMYVTNDARSGKWNDETCSLAKFPACFKAQCNQTSCNKRGRCLEAINNITCLCEPGFEDHRCQTAVTCEQPTRLRNGRIECRGPYGNTSFNASCSFLCLEGYALSGATANIRCNSSGSWDAEEPVCERLAVPCDPPSQPENGFLCCPGGNRTVGSACRFGCSEGFLLLGSSEVTCDSAGAWSGPRPFCASYEYVLIALAGGVVVSTFCCICFCFTRHRKRKKPNQPKTLEEGPTPSCQTGEEESRTETSIMFQ
ncbi:L-selectin-like [Osmerus mordax]|uniref:L-selectin-like n=1 Tax=Osmerus mordax TaxID=8014 RepID=UPI00350F61AE